MATRIDVGDEAPDFELPAQTGETVRLSDHRGRSVVVLYFYPKDDTPGCTAEACAFRDSYEVFTDAGAEVIGVSSDSVASHERFGAAHRVPFSLVSDAGGQLRKRYGVKSNFGVLPGRVTYVIDRDGIVRHVFSSMSNIGGHVKGALAVVEELNAA
jgi:thioredoxin-dependent peroxiredoxin